MKKLLILTLALGVLLCACAPQDASQSTAQSSPQDISQSASQAQSTAPQSAAALPESTSAPQSEAAAETKAVQASVSVANADGTGVLTMQVPTSWTFDYSVFTTQREGQAEPIKIAEVVTVWQVQDAAAPFSEEMTAPFAGTAQQAEEPQTDGLIKTIDRNVNGNLTRTYLYKSSPAGGGEGFEWYPHFTFYVLGDYVVQMHFFSVDADAEDAVFDAVLASMEYHPA